MLKSDPEYEVASEFKRLQLKTHGFVVDAYPDAINAIGVAELMTSLLKLGFGYVWIDGVHEGFTVIVNVLLYTQVHGALPETHEMK